MALKKLVKVKMLVSTAYQGPRKEGEIVTVPEDFAHRWVKNKIAELVGEVPGAVEEETVDEVVEEPAAEDKYASMTAKELYELCQENGIEVEAKKSKAYYIEKLTATEE